MYLKAYSLEYNYYRGSVFFFKYQVYDFFHVHVDVWIKILKRLTQNYSEIWDFWNILRGSCFLAQAGLELVVLLIRGLLMCVSPPPSKDVFTEVPQLLYSHLAKAARDAQ